METGVEVEGSSMGKRPATYADLEALPPHVVGEIVEGELYASPRPAFLHTVAASQLGGELIGPFNRGRGGPGGWIILDEPELHLGADVVVPDLAGWRRERMSRPPRTAATSLAPDWVCEVLSPSTVALDRGAKLRVYARESVRSVWWIDPEARTLEVLRLAGAHFLLLSSHSGDARVRAEPFEAIELELSVLWGEG